METIENIIAEQCKVLSFQLKRPGVARMNCYDYEKLNKEYDNPDHSVISHYQRKYGIIDIFIDNSLNQGEIVVEELISKSPSLETKIDISFEKICVKACSNQEVQNGLCECNNNFKNKWQKDPHDQVISEHTLTLHKILYPNHHFVKNWKFKQEESKEATLAQAIALVGEKNGLSANDISYVYPYILRMLKSKIDWAK